MERIVLRSSASDRPRACIGTPASLSPTRLVRRVLPVGGKLLWQWRWRVRPARGPLSAPVLALDPYQGHDSADRAAVQRASAPNTRRASSIGPSCAEEA